MDATEASSEAFAEASSEAFASTSTPVSSAAALTRS